MINLKELWYSDTYTNLREQVQDRLCFICIAGSHAYGTNTENSDIDIRGVMLPTIDELIGTKRFEQKQDTESDSVIYEFNKFVKLVSDCNPNTIELLGSPQILIFNEVGYELINNYKMFLSKIAVSKFGGYATAQLRRLETALLDTNDEEDELKHLKISFDSMLSNLNKSITNIDVSNMSTEIVDDELVLNMNLVKCPLNTFKGIANQVTSLKDTYNQLNRRNKKKDIAHLQKHVMHLIRLYLMLFDILEKQEINTYRKDDKEFLLSIRNGQRLIIDGKLTNEFYPYLRKLEERLEKDKQITALPNKPNFKEINNFILETNMKVVRETVIKYKEPLFINKEN